MIKSARILALFLLGTLAAGTAFSDTTDIDHRVQAATDILTDLQKSRNRRSRPTCSTAPMRSR